MTISLPKEMKLLWTQIVLQNYYMESLILNLHTWRPTIDIEPSHHHNHFASVKLYFWRTTFNIWNIPISYLVLDLWHRWHTTTSCVGFASRPRNSSYISDGTNWPLTLIKYLWTVKISHKSYVLRLRNN